MECLSIPETINTKRLAGGSESVLSNGISEECLWQILDGRAWTVKKTERLILKKNN